ncbi:hypothetical protein AFLA_013534 [Aspergillus flavus NRRL3357]|nr:hypothetical protein AFLA_013534 [Aspergillus flavus NRRL3357]
MGRIWTVYRVAANFGCGVQLRNSVLDPHTLELLDIEYSVNVDWYHKWLPGIELLTLWATVLGVNGFVSVRYVLLVRNQYAGIIYYWRGQARKGAAPAIID